MLACRDGEILTSWRLVNKPDQGRQTVREPARQDLSTLRASRNVLVDSQSDGSGTVG
jgi:hypothetical protein